LVDFVVVDCSAVVSMSYSVAHFEQLIEKPDLKALYIQSHQGRNQAWIGTRKGLLILYDLEYLYLSHRCSLYYYR
ncbi:MAG: hypothetical protein MHPSP_004333, partial [Paramarteilia canceri]